MQWRKWPAYLDIWYFFFCESWIFGTEHDRSTKVAGASDGLLHDRPPAPTTLSHTTHCLPPTGMAVLWRAETPPGRRGGSWNGEVAVVWMENWDDVRDHEELAIRPTVSFRSSNFLCE
jgi:hypothetical protein